MGLGDFVRGAAGGALGGSSFGLPGTLIGGALGGIAGLFGGGNSQDEMRRRQLEYFDQLGQQGPAAQGDYSQFRENQRAYINNLENAAAGRGPSLATEQLRAATDRSTRQSMGLAQSGAGNPAAAMMMAQEAAGQMGSQNAQTAAAARIQEIYNAQQLLGINLHGARGADEDMNRFNASQQNNYTLDNNRLRGMILANAGGNTSNVSLGDQILAGGAGMFGQSAAMRMARRPQGPQTYTGQGLPPSGIQNPWPNG